MWENTPNSSPERALGVMYGRKMFLVGICPVYQLCSFRKAPTTGEKLK
jgi:hypothetical protein